MFDRVEGGFVSPKLRSLQTRNKKGPHSKNSSRANLPPNFSLNVLCWRTLGVVGASVISSDIWDEAALRTEHVLYVCISVVNRPSDKASWTKSARIERKYL